MRIDWRKSSPQSRRPVKNGREYPVRSMCWMILLASVFWVCGAVLDPSPDGGAGADDPPLIAFIAFLQDRVSHLVHFQ